MTTVYACFLLIAAGGLDAEQQHPQWIFQELTGEHEMRILAEQLEVNDLILDWHCRGYEVVEKEGLA